jgi:hypothetical protein
MHNTHAYIHTIIPTLYAVISIARMVLSRLLHVISIRYVYSNPYFANLVHPTTGAIGWEPPLRLPVINRKWLSRKRNIIRDGQTAIDPCFLTFLVSSFLYMIPGVYIYGLTTCARSKHPHFINCSFFRMKLVTYSNSLYQQRS